MQSSDYKPGVSGWKLDHVSGDFEINSCILGSAAQAPERQMVSIEVGSYSKYDLPKNAANLVQFMEAELQKVPEEYRHAAEFEEFDASYGDDSFSQRLFLSYSRLETEEEQANRQERAKVAGTHVSIVNGVLSVIHDGVLRYRIGKLEQPFATDGGQVILNKAFIRDGTITNAKLADTWSVNMQLTANGQLVTAGIGLGLDSQYLVGADKFAINGRDASAILRYIASTIGDTKLGEFQSDQFRSSIADQIKEVIRTELRPGGLLHR